jgi:glycosyltransferase involved in cell wall biosynthesis
MNTPVFPSHSSVSTAGKLPCIVCCTSAKENWRWLQEDALEKSCDWHFCEAQPRGLLEQLLGFPCVATIRASWQAIQQVQRYEADLLVSMHPALTFWCAVFAALQKVRIYHVAWSFYLPKLPGGIRFLLAQWAYSTINRFIVHSRAERQIYGEHFGISSARFEMHHWGSGAPPIKSIHPPKSDYICVVSRQPQDYSTLMRAIAMLPDISVVLVVPRGQAIAAKIPPNVTIRTGLSQTNRLNILRHARFLVTTMRHSRVLCDYATLVTAMQLGKTFVISDVPSVSDYAFHNSNAILCPPTNPEALAAAIRELWNNLVKCEILGENGKEFAATFCSDAAIQHDFSQLLIRRGL